MADQAAGLRRLISRDFVRILALVAARPGAGASFVTAQLHAALRALGREALRVDASDPLFSGQRLESDTLAAALETRRQGAEIALLDLSSVRDSTQAAWAACALDVVVVMPADDVALRESYALMKRIVSRSGKCRLHILLNQCRDTEYANRIFASLSRTSDQFLSQSVQLLGHLPLDSPPHGGTWGDVNLIDLRPQSQLVRMLRALAERILLWPYPGENDMSGFARRLVAALRPSNGY